MSNDNTLRHGPERNEGPDELQKLANFLVQIPSTEDREMIELLLDMLRDGAIAFKWDSSQGFPIAVYYSLPPTGYGDRIFEMKDDVNALFAEWFLNGETEFFRSTEQLDIAWRFKNRHHAIPPVMSEWLRIHLA